MNYITFINTIHVPIWDGAVFLLNAHQWLNNTNLSEIHRSPIFSWIIDAIWVFTGENWTSIKFVQMAFTMAGIILLYGLLRKRKSALFAFGVSVLTLSNANLFFYTSQIRSEGLSFFFVILTLIFLESSRKRKSWLFTGISIGLTFGTKYPIILQSAVVFIIESIRKKDAKFSIGVILVTISVIVLIISIVYIKTGMFDMNIQRNSFSFTHLPNALSIWGPVIVLLPITFLFKSTYKDKFNYIFISWFVTSLIASLWSVSSYQNWLFIEFMPSTYFLAILSIENLVKFDTNNLVFIKTKVV